MRNLTLVPPTRRLRPRCAPFTANEERDLIRRVKRGDPVAADRLLRGHYSFAVRVASRYSGRGVPEEDLLQEVLVGMLTAARRFDLRRKTRFLTYAGPWCRKFLNEAIWDTSHVIRVPRHVWWAGKVDEAAPRVRTLTAKDLTRFSAPREAIT